MFFLFLSFIIFIVSSLTALFFPRHNIHLWMGGILAPVLMLIPALAVLFSGQVLQSELITVWGHMPLELDHLSAFFILPVSILSIAASFYATDYFTHNDRHRSNMPSFWACYHLLIMSMMMVLIARHALFFLFFWELMSLSSFFLVIFENEKESSRKAGQIYLTITQIGTAALLVLFFVLGKHGHSLAFNSFVGLSLTQASLCFVLALLGFGTKAGIMPLHGWLPDAHPAAPSFVSSLMSGVMIKMGIYGLVRVIYICSNVGIQIPAWWGGSLIFLGALSGIGGVLLALAQHDIKRLLAYHSIENIGIILLGLGVGVYGLSLTSSPQSALLIVLGFGGGLLHVLNHAIFKGLLFLSAGSVIKQTKTHHIDLMGGLQKKMPWTGTSFLVGAISISGLPPFNGFVSEFMIFFAAFYGVSISSQLAGSGLLLYALTILSLALIGGLAVYCFTKAFGIIFLGEKRGGEDNHIHEKENSWRITTPMLTLAALCLLIGIFPMVIVPLLKGPLQMLGHHDLAEMRVTDQLQMLAVAAFLFLGFLLLLTRLRLRVIKKCKVSETVTWDCGYIKPIPRLQYTASSYAKSVVDLFSFFLQTKEKNTFMTHAPYFPTKAEMHTETKDSLTDLLTQLVESSLERSSLLTLLQSGKLNFYILYIVLALLITLFLVIMG